MHIATAKIEDVSLANPVEQIAEQVDRVLEGRPCSLCVLFASAHFEDHLPMLVDGLHERLAPGAFIGTSAEAVIASGQEYENRPGLVVWAAHLPGVDLRSFHLLESDLERFGESSEFASYVGMDPSTDPTFLLLADPFSFNPTRLLELLNETYPGAPAFGGMASGGQEPGQNTVIFEGQPLRQGLAGLAIAGHVRIDPVVSQGCRPIGRHLVITEAEQNVIRQLGGKPPLEVLTEILRDCPTRDLELARTRGLLIGRVINEQQSGFRQGDFLIRNPLGFDQASGAMHINDYIRTGQTVQFHVRDGASASEDLEALLGERSRRDALGALVFSCNGRGSRLFPQRHHDANAVQAACGCPSVAGFFCAGEIGPIGGANFLHGHTASIAFFREPEPGT